MRDEEYVFYETSRERKRVARSAKNVVRGGGRTVRMPSDILTKKERNALNGEVKGYDMASPMVWARFRKMPLDLQQEYLNRVVDRFPGVPNVMIAEMFGVGDNTLNPYLFRNKIKIDRGPGAKKINVSTFLDSEPGDRFMKWVCGESEVVDVKKVEPVVEAPAEPVVVEEKPVVERPVKVSGDVDINNISVLLRALVGSGAKLTIEINL